jgi:uncharacterized membrane protein
VASRAASILLIGAVVWSATIPLAPRVARAATPRTPLALVLATAAAYEIGGTVCHQRRDRSFHTASVRWPVCARCAGLYMSAGLGGVLILALRRQRGFPPAVTRRGAMLLLLGAGAPTTISWAAERLGLLATTNEWRAALAVPLGLAVSALVAFARRRPGTPVDLR